MTSKPYWLLSFLLFLIVFYSCEYPSVGWFTAVECKQRVWTFNPPNISSRKELNKARMFWWFVRASCSTPTCSFQLRPTYDSLIVLSLNFKKMTIHLMNSRKDELENVSERHTKPKITIQEENCRRYTWNHVLCVYNRCRCYTYRNRCAMPEKPVFYLDRRRRRA